MGGVGTSIIGRPRPSTGDRRAHPYTVNCEEPRRVFAPTGCSIAAPAVFTVSGALLGVSPAWVRLFVATGQGMPGAAADHFGHTVGMCSH